MNAQKDQHQVIKVALFCVFSALFVLGCSNRDHVLAEERSLGFSGDIKDIMAQFCFECHGVENTESGLDLRTIESMLKGGEGGPVLVPGKLEESLLFKMIHHGKMHANLLMGRLHMHLQVQFSLIMMR